MTAEGEGAGMAPAAVEALRERARRDVEDGILPSCQIALAVDGRVALFETFGRDRRDPRYQVYSVTKALVAGAVWILLGEGRLATDTRVAEVIPGFGTNGKDAVRVEHLLTHGPVPGVAPRLGAGHALRVPPTSAHWVLAELIDRAGATDHRRYVAERVMEPLGLARLRLGVPRGSRGTSWRPSRSARSTRRPCGSWSGSTRAS